MTTIAERALQLLSLEGQVAVITGAASGIGRGIAIRLAEMGAAVVLLDFDQQKGKEATSEMSRRGGKALFISADVRAAPDCKRAIAETLQTFGKIDILCNNAGVAIRKSVESLSEDEWDLAVDVTLKS